MAIPGFEVGADGVVLAAAGALSGEDRENLTNVVRNLMAAGRTTVTLELWQLRDISEDGVELLADLRAEVEKRGGSLRLDAYPNATVERRLRPAGAAAAGFFNYPPLDREVEGRFARLRRLGIRTMDHPELPSG